MGKPFNKSGFTAFPYPEMLSVAFFSHSWLQEQADAWNTLSKLPEMKTGSTDDILQGFAPLTKDDLQWRSNHLRQELNFWDMARSNFPTQLSDRALGDIDLFTRNVTKSINLTAPTISGKPEFQNSLLMVTELRTFHRNDGRLYYLLLINCFTAGAEFVANSPGIVRLSLDLFPADRS